MGPPIDPTTIKLWTFAVAIMASEKTLQNSGSQNQGNVGIAGQLFVVGQHGSSLNLCTAPQLMQDQKA
jgi:hypothetical protein